MARKRDIEAYKRRLAKMTDARQLQARDIGAIATLSNFSWHGPIEGRIIAVTHRQGIGLLGPIIVTDVTICTACINGPACCDRDSEIVLDHAALHSIRIGGTTDD